MNFLRKIHEINTIFPKIFNPDHFWSEFLALDVFAKIKPMDTIEFIKFLYQKNLLVIEETAKIIDLTLEENHTDRISDFKFIYDVFLDFDKVDNNYPESFSGNFYKDFVVYCEYNNDEVLKTINFLVKLNKKNRKQLKNFSVKRLKI